jgi:hypothetical protein
MLLLKGGCKIGKRIKTKKWYTKYIKIFLVMLRVYINKIIWIKIYKDVFGYVKAYIILFLFLPSAS